MRYETSRRSIPLPLGEPAELVFEAEALAVTLVPLALGETPHIETSGQLARSLRIDVSREGNVVHIKAEVEDLPTGLFSMLGGGPHAWLTLHVPEQISARVRTSLGRIKAHGLKQCALDLESDAGDVSLQDIQGKLKVRMGAGKISGEGLAGSFDIRTEAGAVRLGIVSLDEVAHHIGSRVGAVRIALVPDLRARLEADAALGAIRSDYPFQEEAPAVLHVTTEIGSIRIRSTRPGRREGAHTDRRFRFRWRGAPDIFFAIPSPPPGRPPFYAAGIVPPMPQPPPQPPRSVSVGIRREEQHTERETPPAAAASEAPVVSPDARETEMERILAMVEEGKLSARDAGELLRALGHF